MLRKRIISMVVTAAMLTTALLPSFAFAAPQPSSDWSASWIWDSAKPTGTDEGDQWVNFRKEFELTSVPTEAVNAKISAESRYWLYINGELAVFEGGLKRGINREDGYYDVVDITKYLKTGTNTIAVAVWYYGVTNQSFTGWCADAAGFMFEAQIGDVTVKSDSSWKAKRDSAYLHSANYEDALVQPGSRFIESNIYYNASLELSDSFMGWTAEDYDDSAWGSAVVRGSYGDSPWNKLYERSIPLLKFDKTIQAYENPEAYAAYTDAYTTAETVISMELPYNAQVTPYIEIEAKDEGLLIDMRTDTYNYYNFTTGVTSATEASINSVKSAYVTKAGAQSFEALGWFSGEKVIYTIPAGVKIVSLGYRESGYDTEFTGSFVSDNEGLNTLWQKAVRTLYVTMRDNYMDCPDRERAQWWGDVTSEMYMAFYALDPRSWDLYEKGLYTKLGFIKDDILYTVVPNTNYYAEYVQQELAGVVGVWQYYMYSGRKYIIEDFYEAGKNYLALWNMQENGLIEHRSFKSGYDSWVDWGTNQDVTATENAWYYMALDAVINMAKLLGKTEDIPALQHRRDQIYSAFESFWTDEGYRSPYIASKTYPDDRANALAVLSGLATADKYDTILGILTNPDNYFAGPYFEKYVLDAMVKMGAVEEAQTRILTRYDDMIKSDISTLYEGWTFPNETYAAWSKNHAWTGGPLITMSKDMAGIAPLEAGYKTYEIKPVLGTLSSVNVTVPSAVGNIKASIVKATDGTYTMDITSPGGTAVVAVPRISGKATVVKANDTVIFDGSNAANSVSGIVYSKNDADYIYFNVSAGTYKFVTTTSAAESDEYSLSIPAGVGGTVTATVGGSEVEVPYSGTVAKDTEVTVTATADAGYEFSGFSGTVGASSSPLTFTLSANTQINAEFTRLPVDTRKTLTVNIPDDSDVSVYVNGESVANGGTFKADAGTELTIEAKDGNNFKFVNFEGDIYSASKELSLTLTQDMTISVKSAFAYITMYEAGNVALGATVTSSDLYNVGTWKTTGLTDGNYNVGATSHQSPSTPHTITVDLGESKTFNTVTLYPRTDEVCCFPKDFTVTVSEDGSTYTSFASYTGVTNVTSPFVITNSAVTARYIKITTTALGNKSSVESGARIQLMELEAAYVPESETNTVTVTNDTVSTGTGKVLINGTEYTLPAQIESTGDELIKVEAVADENCIFAGFTGSYSSTSSVMYFYALNNIELSAKFLDNVPDDADAEDSTNYALGGSVTVKNTSGAATGTYYSNGSWELAYLTDGIVGDAKKLGMATKGTSVGYEIIVAMKEQVKISQIVMYARTDSGGVTDGKSQGYVPGFDIYVSTDGTTYTKVKSVTGETNIAVANARRVYNLDAAYDAKYIKITATTINGNIHIQELEAYNAPVNRAMNATVTNNGNHLQTSSSTQSWYYTNLTDGYTMVVGSKEGYSSGNLSATQDISASPFELEIDMGTVKNINQVVLHGRTSDHATAADSGICPCFPENFTIQVSTDGTNYTTVKTVTGENKVTHADSKRVYELDYYVPARYIKLVVTKLGASTAAEGAKSIHRVQLTEMEAFLVEREYTAPTLSVSIEDGVKHAGYSFDATVNTTSSNTTLTIEDENGNVSAIADAIGTTIVPKSAGTAYLVVRDESSAVATSRTAFTVANHIIEKVTGKAATEDADGWKDYYYCKTCGTYFEDEGATKEITDLDAWKLGDGAVLYKAAENTVTGKTYKSLELALDDAKAGDTVKLVDNVTVDNACVLPSVTLDLSGYTLTTNHIVGFNGSNVIDSSEGKTGKAVVAKDNMTLSKDNTQIPVYDSEKGCYVFIGVTTISSNGNVRYKYELNSETQKYVYSVSPVFGKNEAERTLAHSLIGKDSAATGIKVVIRVSWTDDSYKATQDYAYNETTVESIVNTFAGDNYGEKFTATFSGSSLTEATDVQVSTVVISQTGAEAQSGSLSIDVQ